MKRFVIVLCAVCLGALISGCAQQVGEADLPETPDVESEQAAQPDDAAAQEQGAEKTTGQEASSEDTKAAQAEQGAAADDAGSAALPAWSYQGEDVYKGAVCERIIADDMQMYGQCDVWIPAPVVFKTDDSNPEDVKLWAVVWSMGYNLKDKTLVCESGGEHSVLAHLRHGEDGAVELVSLEEARDGADNAADIKRFCDGDEQLAQRYFDETSIAEGDSAKVRAAFVAQYVASNGLDITALQDPGWNPVEL